MTTNQDIFYSRKRLYLSTFQDRCQSGTSWQRQTKLWVCWGGGWKNSFLWCLYMYSTYSPRAKNNSNILMSFSLHLYFIQQLSLSSTIELSIPLKPYFWIQEIIVYQLWGGEGISNLVQGATKLKCRPV